MFLAHLLQRTLGGETGIRPRRAARFEPAAPPAPEEPALTPLPAARAPAPPRSADGETRAPPPPLAIAPIAGEIGKAAPAPAAVIVPRQARRDAEPQTATTPARTAGSAPPPAGSRRIAPRPQPPSDVAGPRRPSPRQDATQAPAAAQARVPTSAPVERVTTSVVTRSVEQRLASLARETGPAPAAPRTATSHAAPAPSLPTARAPRAAPAPAVPSLVAQRRPRQGPSPAPAAPPEPVVEIRIGRVELRALSGASPAAAQRSPAPVSTLETYLRARDRN